MQKIEITSFRSLYKEQVIQLILDIQRNEFKVPITLQDQPDLENVEAFYQAKKGNFWVANDEGKVVGTVALLDVGNNIGALRKMFVRDKYRGKEIGVGQQLLDTLLEWAKRNNFERILLGTTERMRAASRFYEKNGFIKTARKDLPCIFPVMKVDTVFYELKFIDKECLPFV
ncbi:MAG: GNAT family N-acetyltransferase [Bacteroidetes bacterium]|nr:MAG: GNAT family N-acetyltransferase [Bacteroidota bacterium]